MAKIGDSLRRYSNLTFQALTPEKALGSTTQHSEDALAPRLGGSANTYLQVVMLGHLALRLQRHGDV